MAKFCIRQSDTGERIRLRDDTLFRCTKLQTSNNKTAAQTHRRAPAARVYVSQPASPAHLVPSAVELAAIREQYWTRPAARFAFIREVESRRRVLKTTPGSSRVQGSLSARWLWVMIIKNAGKKTPKNQPTKKKKPQSQMAACPSENTDGAIRLPGRTPAGPPQNATPHQ